MKTILLILMSTFSLLCATQKIVVTTKELNSTTATLQRYEDSEKVGDAIKVNIGRSGMSYDKKEGDGNAPAGEFKLGNVYGYKQSAETKMPYIQISSDLICVDDSTHKEYNKIITIQDAKKIKSFEFMKRDDELYELLIEVKYNTKNTPKKGSCIFIHLQRDQNLPTAGCTSMSKENMNTLLKWLDPNKKPIFILK
ncbi:MAG: L,D-transpeptidase family protein [Helicobacteraceae bacterium]|nr:L,D-transpeptidase family protein [Helicobacteraceae bacterium]